MDLSAASQGAIPGFKATNALTVDLSASSHLRGGTKARDAWLDLSNGSQVTLSGSVGDVTINASGGSAGDLADFPATNANAGARDASEVTVNASGTWDVDASGASHITYLGSPTLETIATTDASRVEPK